jgi:hypothetical protein
MSDRETEFDFDFFEEPETQETPARTRGPTRRPRTPVRPPSGLTPLLRLIGLIAFAIAAIVVLVFVIQSCRSEDKRETYADYVRDVRPIARDSQGVGRQLNRLLTEPGVRLRDIDARLDGLIAAEEEDIATAGEVTPPGLLREQHRRLVDALEFRVGGLRRLQSAFRQSPPRTRPRVAGRRLAAPMRRFIASDVIWDDGFRDGTVEVLREEDVTGVDVPDSNFLPDPELATAADLARFWERIRGVTTGQRGPGPHGTALVSTRVLPGGEELSTERENLVIASTDPPLAFQVTVENSGRSQQVRVRVRLTVEQEDPEIRKTATIPVIDPGEQRTVTFRDLGRIVQFAQNVPVRVEVVPVEGEANPDNNAAEYPVTFRIG